MPPTPPVRLESDFQIYGEGNVRPHRLRFDPCDPAFLARNGDGTVTIRVLGPVDAVEGTLALRAGGEVLGYPLGMVGAAGAASLFEVTIAPPAAHFVCSFALRLGDGTAVYLGPTGVATAIERLDHFAIAVDALPTHQAPRWAAGAVLYQVFPDRFANGDPSLDPEGIVPWDATPTSRDRFGGDLPGIADHVDHLVDLGVDAVYLNPIFASPSNHRYDTIDYLSVDPALGGDEALHRLVAVLHANDIRLILDASFNHCHPRFFAFADVVARGPASPYAAWFAVREWPVRVRYRPHLVEPGTYWGRHLDRLRTETGIPVEAVGGDGPLIEPTYDCWHGVPIMPRIELAHPDARRYMLDVAAHWLRRFAVDGWRMDVVRYVDHDFWTEFRREVKAVAPDAYLLAEVMGDAGRWLRGDEFDGTMNYTFRDLVVAYLAAGTVDTAAFLEGLLEMTAMYSPTAGLLNHNLIGSHDTPRFLTLAGGNQRMLLMATLLQLTLPGVAGIYYGDELGMEGGGDPDNRRAMAWPDVGNEIHRAFRELTTLRRRHQALRTGSFRLLATVDDGFVFDRTAGGDAVAVAVNRGERPVAVPVATGELEWSLGRVEAAATAIRLGPRSAAVVSRAPGPEDRSEPGIRV